MALLPQPFLQVRLEERLLRTVHSAQLLFGTHPHVFDVVGVYERCWADEIFTVVHAMVRITQRRNAVIRAPVVAPDYGTCCDVPLN